MRLEPIRIVNTYRNANAYVIPTVQSDSYIMIDAGGPDIINYEETIGAKPLEAIFLTHEHADHCLLVEELVSRYKCRVFGSKACSENIKDSKHNFSHYIEEIPTFSITTDIEVLEDGQLVNVGGVEITCIETPGHSPGSTCFKIENCLFTGDTILNGFKSPTSFPHSNKRQYIESINYLLEHIESGDRIFPGHGPWLSFYSREELLVSIGIDS